MSLDVYLLSENPVVSDCVCSCGHQHTREDTEYYFEANITHNLNKMAQEAGIYEAVWHPSAVGIHYAKDLINPLSKGIQKLKANPIFFKRFEPENRWGTYEDFVPWLERYYKACVNYPDAVISANG